MPFAINAATRYINPTKTLEYMAAGKPIVSTPVPDVARHFVPIVEVAASPDEFVSAVGSAIDTPRARAIEDGIELAGSSSWDAIVGKMRKHMLDTIGQPARIAA